jgi:zinc transporter
VIALNSPFSVLRHQTARIRRYLAPQKEALDRLSRTTDPIFSADDKARFTEQAKRITLFLEDLDLVRERAMVAQEEYLGIVAHEQNARMLVLSIVAAVFLPLAFLTALMGMNVAGLPGMENPWAFWILLVLMLLSAGIILVLFRIKRWF